MAVSAAALSTAEKYLVALIQDRSGIDLAEFLWEDPMASNKEKIFRCWDFQYAWWRDSYAQGTPVDDPTLVIDSCARAVGKTQSIIVRSWAFAVQSPGGEMVVTAPELVHLDPLTSRIEDRLKEVRLTRELLPRRVGMGFKHRPFQVNFTNGAKILGRIPQRDGKGVKGCVVEGTPILTADGYVPVEELSAGDLVLTHTGAWRPVREILVDTNDCYRVTGSQSMPLEVSSDHAFLGARNEAGPKSKRVLSETSWFDADDLDGVYWASPVRFDPLPVVPVEHFGTAHRFQMTAGFWWLVGRWLADGFVSRSRKTGKSRKVHWVVHPTDAESVEMRLENLGFSPRTVVRSHSSADVVEVASAGWERWLVRHFGSGAANKTLPGFVLGMDERHRQALLGGYLSGDGHWNPKKERWESSSASRALALGTQMLGQSLGFGAIVSSVEPKSQFTDTPLRSWRVYLTTHGHHVWEGDHLLAKVRKVESIGKRRVFNPIVAGDHSYVAGSVVSHNLHPLRLEMDEAQDFPQSGWIELIETLRHGEKGAQWRAHGVSKGVRDEFYRHSQPGSGWTVHRVCLPEGTLVYGVDGPFAIEDAKVGDKVWSIAKDGSLVEDEVTDTIDNGIKYTWKVQAKGGFGLETTPNHPYLVLSRSGTPRTRRELDFEWVEAQNVKPGDYIVGVEHLDDTGAGTASGEEITEMLDAHSPTREVPKWVWGASRALQLAFLAGYLMGDGSLAHQRRGQDPWQISTSSERMARQLRALCHYLGFRPTALVEADNTRSIVGGAGVMWTFYAYGGRSWFRQIPKSYSQVRDGQYLEGLDKRLVARRVSASEPTGRAVHTYDISVGERHNYIAEGVVVHNTGMHRPTWSDAEREDKIEAYGSRDSADYKRNILGLHGDATNPLFVLHRLMACVDDEQGSDYNQDVYYYRRISDEMLSGQSMEMMLVVPGSHKQWNTTWAGMDVGMTNHPSEILIFGEESTKGNVLLRMLARIHLERIRSADQRRAIEILFDAYDFQLFTMDRTGLGLPMYQELQDAAPKIMSRVKGYNADEKLVVGWQDHEDWEDPDDYEIKRPAKEYGYDQLRVLVDEKRLILPWDREMLGEWQGQTWSVQRAETDAYGKKNFARGKFHTLDAAAMMVVGRDQQSLVAFSKVQHEDEPVPLIWA